MLGRYPFHWHIAGEQSDSYITDCSIHTAHYRCVVLHGTNAVNVARNVAVNVTGHCFYLEDGVEENNNIEFNLAAWVHVIGTGAVEGGQGGQTFTQTPELLQPADAGASGFYITNAYNTFRGNAASGGWSGFSIVNLPAPIGEHRPPFADPVTCTPEQVPWGEGPLNRPFKVFDGNSAHSSGNHFFAGACIYVGGLLVETFDEANGCEASLTYNSGRHSRAILKADGSGEEETLLFSNTRVWMCRRGINAWGDREDVVNFESHDVSRSATLFGHAYFHNALVNAMTDNVDYVDASLEGFETYDTWTLTLLDDVEFRNFNDDHCSRHPLFGTNGWRCDVFHTLVHSDVFKPQDMNLLRNIQYTNVDRSRVIRVVENDSGSSRMYNMESPDGSAFMLEEHTWSGSHIDWWRRGDDCTFDTDFKLWLCPATPGHSVGHLFLNMPGFSFNAADSQHTPGYYDGYIALMNGGNHSVKLTPNPGYTGFNDYGWYFKVFRGTPAVWDVTYMQIRRGEYLLLAMPYPPGTTFTVTAHEVWYWPDGFDHTVPQAASLNDLLVPESTMGDPETFDCPSAGNGDPHRLCTSTGTPGPLYYFDDAAGVLYVRFVNLRYYTPLEYSTMHGFSRAGMYKEYITNSFTWRVEATCPAATTFTQPGRTGRGIQPGSEVAEVTFCDVGGPAGDTIPHPYTECSRDAHCSGTDVCDEYGSCVAAPPPCPANNDLFLYDDGSDGLKKLATSDCLKYLASAECDAAPKVTFGTPGEAGYVEYWILRDLHDEHRFGTCS